MLRTWQAAQYQHTAVRSSNFFHSRLPLPVKSVRRLTSVAPPPTAAVGRLPLCDCNRLCDPHRSHQHRTLFTSSHRAGDTPPPSNSNVHLKTLLANAARHTLTYLRRGIRTSVRHARAHPTHVILLLTACGLGFLWANHRRHELAGTFAEEDAALRPVDGTNLARFQSPAWAHDSDTKRELAQLLHLMPRIIYLMRTGEEHSSIGGKTLSSIPSSVLDSDTTAAQAMERLCELIDQSEVLDTLATDVPPSALIEPLVSLVCNPAIHPHMAKYAAAMINRMCNQPDGRLCKLIGAHSTYDLLIALSPYTDFLSWNYVYLLQQQPQLVAVAEQLIQSRRPTTHISSSELPPFLRPFHHSSSLPAPTAASQPPVANEELTMNHNSSPVSNFLSHFFSSNQTPPSSHTDPTPESRALISLLLSLPPVHSHTSGETPVGILHHAIETGAAQREQGSSIVDAAREMGKDVVQQGAGLAAAFRSALAADDLTILTEASRRWNPDLEHTTGIVDQMAVGVQRVQMGVSNALHNLLSRRSSYKLGQQWQQDRREARKQEIAYHAFRAIAALSQDPDTAAMILEGGGVDLLYRVYQQYPNEMRVQIQVARTLANLLEHAHARLDGVAPTATHESDARYATYHTVAQSGFLPMLVHWSQHALNFTDAAPTTTTNNQNKKKQKRKTKNSNNGKPSDITRTPPSQSHTNGNGLATVKGLNGDASSSPSLPPPAVLSPADIAAGASATSITPDAEDVHPLRQPHHPDSSASQRNTLQMQSARALVNLRSIQSFKYLSEHPDDRHRWLQRHDTVSFPILTDDVYQLYPIADTLRPQTPDAAQSNARKYSKSAKRIGDTVRDQPTSTLASTNTIASSSFTPPVAAPPIEYDIVFLHGLMGSPLRTWRLHSMHDRTIGWIPSTPEEKRRAGAHSNGGKEVQATVPIADSTKTSARSPLDLHLSNLVVSAPVPANPDAADRPTIADAESDPASMAYRTNVWGDLAMPTRAADAPSSSPSPAAPPNTHATATDSVSAVDESSHTAIHSSHHSLDFETLWPRDWLPFAFPRSRILSMGYFTPLRMPTAAGELHSKSLEDRAREMAEKMDLAGIGKDGRKVVWVVHSMGGLIVKKVLLNAALAKRAAIARGDSPSTAPHAQLLDSTIATVFYSTPHHGTWLPVSRQDGLLSYLYLPSHELIDLQNIPKLRALNSDFKHEVIDPYGVRSLAMGEGIGTPLIHLNRTAQRMINWKFVPIASSQPGFGDYLYFPTQNHLTICKPKTELDENYSAVVTFIKEAMEAQVKANKKQE